MGSQGREDRWLGGGWRTRWSHICMHINWEEQLGRDTDCGTQGSSLEKWTHKPLTKNTCGGWGGSRRNSQLHKEFAAETHRVLKSTQTHPPGNQHQKGPICLWVAGKWLKTGREWRKWHCSLLDPLPHKGVLPRHGESLRFCPFLCKRWAKTKKYGPNERRDQNSRKRTKWLRDSQPIRRRVQNTGNQDAHRNGWVWLQNRGRNERYATWNNGKCTGNQQ